MNSDIDIESLRIDLIDYFTSAMFAVSPVALVDLTRVENAKKMSKVWFTCKNIKRL